MEDDKAIREMYRLKFELANIPIHTAEEGRDALKKALRLKPDILLLDIKIPTLGGEEVLQKLQSQKWLKKTKIIILTNINFREAPKQIHDLHFDKYIVKAHYTPAKVVKAVQEFM